LKRSGFHTISYICICAADLFDFVFHIPFSTNIHYHCYSEYDCSYHDVPPSMYYAPGKFRLRMDATPFTVRRLSFLLVCSIGPDLRKVKL